MVIKVRVTIFIFLVLEFSIYFFKLSTTYYGGSHDKQGSRSPVSNYNIDSR